VIVEPSVARLEGNLAKQRVQHRLRELIAATPDLAVLDVGCVGPSPLDIWRWIFEDHAGRFSLLGVDVAGIERAQAAARERGWPKTRFLSASGYELDRALGGEAFDVVVCTQVLEHVRHLDRFVAQLRGALRPDGRVLLTLDSGHFRRRVGPGRAVAKWLLVRLGAERYHELGWRDEALERAFAAHGLRVVDRKYLNLDQLKWIHNHGVGAPFRDPVAERWYAYELALNEDARFIAASKSLFRGLYYELVVAS
jgi:2-polyprenyl-3-methyl-5-hydroxy-6-metoxy-1,4-benzoquinol methylase